MARKPQTESGKRSVAKKTAGAKSGSVRTGRKPTPLKDLSPAYRKRIKDAAANAGVPVKEFRRNPALTAKARGHAPTKAGKTESQVRRERRDARIDKFVNGQVAKFPGADDEIRDKMRAALLVKIRDQGMGYLAGLQAEIARMNREYMGQTKRDKRGRRPSVGYDLDLLGETEELPPETFGYH